MRDGVWFDGSQIFIEGLLRQRKRSYGIAGSAESRQKAIGRAFGKQSSSIYFLVAPHDGIRPAQRRRSRLALTLAEREVISRGVTTHQSARDKGNGVIRSLIGIHKDAYQFVSDRYWQSGRSAGLSPLIEVPARASKIDGIEAFRKSGIDFTQKLPALARAALSMAQPPKHHRSAQFPR